MYISCYYITYIKNKTTDGNEIIYVYSFYFALSLSPLFLTEMLNMKKKRYKYRCSYLDTVSLEKKMDEEKK